MKETIAEMLKSARNIHQDSGRIAQHLERLLPIEERGKPEIIFIEVPEPNANFHGYVGKFEGIPETHLIGYLINTFVVDLSDIAEVPGDGGLTRSTYLISGRHKTRDTIQVWSHYELHVREDVNKALQKYGTSVEEYEGLFKLAEASVQSNST